MKTTLQTTPAGPAPGETAPSETAPGGAVAIQPLQWESVPHISRAAEFSARDEACFREVRDVLRRHDALDRFGLTLIHSHFPVAEDEILLEETDTRARTQTVRTVKRDEVVDADVTVTNWRLTDGDAVHARTCVCARTSDSHTGGHAAV